MRILLINKFLYPNGGSETYVFGVGEELARQGHEVQYFGMEHAGRIVGNRAGAYTRDMDFHAGGLFRLSYPLRILYSREARRKLRAVLCDFRPQAVHLNNINFQLTPSVIDEIRAFEKKTGSPIRIVYTAHDYQWVCPNHLLLNPETKKPCEACTHGMFFPCVKSRCIHGSRAKSVLGAAEGWLYRVRRTYEKVDAVVCPSAFMERMLSRNPALVGRTVVLHNFIEKEETAAAGAGDVPAEAPYVLYFGRYAEEKGVRTLLAACRALPDVRFVFAGKGELAEQIAGAENAEDLGFLSGETLRSRIRGARFVVFPSECHENCPFSVLEAQALGVPVLASDLGGTPELLCTEPGRETGALFPAGDEKALTAAIRRLWDDAALCGAMAGHARAWMSSFDTRERYCEKLVRLYEEGKTGIE